MAKRANTTVAELRAISKAIEDYGHEVLFVENDCPFVDRAIEAIEHGGTLDATSLASLIYYIADMME
jgi:hypothetical protein